MSFDPLRSARILGPGLVRIGDGVTFLAGCATLACQRACVRKHPMLSCDLPLRIDDWASCPYCFAPAPDQEGSR
jgi:hypothetical protein